jgi:hypothetical protein
MSTRLLIHKLQFIITLPLYHSILCQVLSSKAVLTVSDVARHREHTPGAAAPAPSVTRESVWLRNCASYPRRATARVRGDGPLELPGRGIRRLGHVNQPRSRTA